MEKNRISSPPPQQTAPAAPTQRSKQATQAAPDDASGGAGGFLSLLSALGDSMECAAEAIPLGSAIDPELVEVTEDPLVSLLPVALAADDTLPAAVLPSVADDAPVDLPAVFTPLTDAAALMAWLSGNMRQTAQTAQMPQVAQTGISQAVSAAVNLEQQGASTLSLAQGNALTGLQNNSLASLQTELVPLGGLVAQTARLDGAADVRAQDAQNPLLGSRRGFSRASSALSSGLASVSTAALAAGQRSVGGDKPLASAASAALTATPAVQTAPERRDAAAAGAGIPRTGSEFNPTPAQAAQIAAPAPDAFARSTGDRAMPGGTTEVWGGGTAGPEASQSVETGTAVAEPQQTAAEDALADQVAFWVSENLQNAELTVTHDGKPVEVSVSMSGKEAHIVFGSDQSETRDLLDASVAQLRELLQSEGLILSGMTVGNSGARNANPDGSGSSGSSDRPRGRQGARQAQVLAPVAEAGVRRANVVTDKSVDVFV